MSSERSAGFRFARRIGSVVMGLVSLGLLVFGIFGIVDVASTYGDAFGGGWGLLWLLVGGLALLTGAGSVALWNRQRRVGFIKSLVWIGGVVVLLVLLVFFLPRG